MFVIGPTKAGPRGYTQTPELGFLDCPDKPGNDNERIKRASA
jgi:hypothetical protein